MVIYEIQLYGIVKSCAYLVFPKSDLARYGDDGRPVFYSCGMRLYETPLDKMANGRWELVLPYAIVWPIVRAKQCWRYAVFWEGCDAW